MCIMKNNGKEYATPTFRELNVNIEAGFQVSGYGDHGDPITPGDGDYNW